MKNLMLTIQFMILVMIVIAQPQAFKYQTIIRDAGGELVADQAVALRIDILTEAPDGTVVYTEDHTVTTNEFGLVNLEIGRGTAVFGIFSEIDWGSGDHFLKLSMDIAGGSNFVFAGVTQLLSVPYALYAKESGDDPMWQPDGNNIFYNNGKVGIGTNTPTRLLHLYGGDALIETPEWSDLTIRTTTAGTDASLLLRTVTDGLWANDNYWAVYNDVSEDNKFTIQYKDQRRMTISNNGYVGIGTNQPGSLLDIHGGTRFTVRLDNETKSKVGNLYSSDDTLALVSYGNVDISIDENNNSTGKVFRVVNNSGTNELLRVQDNGRVGIGTNSPQYRFHVKNGDAMIEDTSWCDLKIKATNEGKDPALQLYAGDDYWAFNHDDSEENDLDIRFNNSTKLSIETDGRVGIGTGQPDPSALLQVYSTSKGFLPPRMNTTQIAAIQNPANGLMVYNTSDGHPYVFNTSDYKWKRVAFDATTITPDFVCGYPMVDTRDGQVYNTVEIGNQCWMAENLNIGTMINGANNQANNGIIEKYCYDNNSSNCNTYGGLYQWNEMMQYVTTPGAKGICPNGWHIPEYSEVIALSNYLGGNFIAGGKLKEAGTIHWNPPNTSATNESGYTALPEGGMGVTAGGGIFAYLGENGHISSSTQDGNRYWSGILRYDEQGLSFGTAYKPDGYPLRCIKN